MALHDSLAVSYLLNPEWFDTVESSLRVVTEGICIGQSLLKPKYRATRVDPFANLKSQQICLDVDVNEVKKHFLNALANNF